MCGLCDKYPYPQKSWYNKLSKIWKTTMNLKNLSLIAYSAKQLYMVSGCIYASYFTSDMGIIATRWWCTNAHTITYSRSFCVHVWVFETNERMLSGFILIAQNVHHEKFNICASICMYGSGHIYMYMIAVVTVSLHMYIFRVNFLSHSCILHIPCN